jgi:hypothetical protein
MGGREAVVLLYMVDDAHGATRVLLGLIMFKHIYEILNIDYLKKLKIQVESNLQDESFKSN